MELDTPSQLRQAAMSMKSPDRQSVYNYINGAAADVYENEDFGDYFMEDMDEMSLCEGSR